MDLKTINQQPQLLNSLYKFPLSTPLDIAEIINEQVVKPLFTPLMPSQDVKITCDGKEILPEHITELMLYCSGENMDMDAETVLHELFRQTLAYYEKTLTIQNVYAVQSAKKYNMLIPSDKVQYIPTDVIDASKQLLAGQMLPEIYFSTMAFYTRVQSLGFYFANETAWNDFKNWFNSQVTNIKPVLPAETTSLCQDLQKITLSNMTESFLIRDNLQQNNEPYSFAMVFIFYLMMYKNELEQKHEPAYTMGQLPFSFIETFCPRTIIIINVEKHAHATPDMIKKEWKIIQKSLELRPTIVDKNTLLSLSAVTRMSQKMASTTYGKSQDISGRSATIRFRKTPPTSYDLYKFICSIYQSAKRVLNSENTIKRQKNTYNRPSRRRPDDYDAMGKTMTIEYRPDFHIYLDCSGSITEQQYQDVIKMIIKLAKRMNINIYFNSFSDVISTVTKLHVKDRTIKQIYTEFKNIPKVEGGTDYEQVWAYINRNRRRQNEISVLITDFAYTAPNHFVKHPRFLYYAPVSSYNWPTLTRNAKKFVESMLAICPGIRKQILI